MFIDTHCHLASRTFEGEWPELIDRAREFGVTRMITIGTDLEDSRKCVELAEQFPEVYATVGIHPTSAHEIEAEDWLAQIEQLAAHPKVAAIGEIGLDYFHAPPKGMSEEDYHARQKDFFRAQLALAERLGLNVVVHNRNSWKDTAAEVVPYNGRLRAVFHCFTGNWFDDAAELVAHGHLISFTGIATFKNATDVHWSVRDATPGSWMLETDAPYLAPEPYRGKRCEPAYTRVTADAIAQMILKRPEEIAEMTTRTAEGFFRLTG